MTDLTGACALVLRPWPDHPPPGPGVGPHTAYVDRYWLPLLGPLPTSLARLVTRVIHQEREAVRMPAREITAALGVPGSEWAAVVTALEALEVEGIVSFAGDGGVHARAELPHLDAAQVARLPAGLQVAHRTALALRAQAPPGTPPSPLPGSARLLSLAATIDEVVTRPDLRPRQLAYRFQHLVRLAEEGRDEALLDWAAPDLAATLIEGQLAGRTVAAAIWTAQHEVARRGMLPDARRAALRDAAAALVDWLVAEFPPGTTAPLLDGRDR